MSKKIWLSVGIIVVLSGAILLFAQAQVRQGGQGGRQFNQLPAGVKTLPKSETERYILSVLEDMQQNQSPALANVSAEDGRMLRLLVEAVNAQSVVEVGTSNGYSAIWIAMALQATGGKLTTFENDADRADLARKNFNRAGVENIVTLVEGNNQQNIPQPNGSIDVLFINADKQGYPDYFEKLSTTVRPGGLILAHNIGTENKAIQEYLETITTNKDLETVFHTQSGGLSITLKKLPQPQISPAKPELKEIREPDVIFVPTPQEVVDKMLEIVKVTKDDIVYDLGCGDGRIVVTAAKKYGCTAYGYDIDPKRVRESWENISKNDVGHLVTVEQKDIFTLDLSKADVVTLYLLPILNVKLIPQLKKLKPGSRIVSHDFDMEGVKPDQVVEIEDEDGYSTHTIYFWTTPLKIIKDNEPE